MAECTVMALGTPELAEEKCKEAIEIFAMGGGFILGPGCGLPPKTPSENLHTMVETAKTYGVYNPDGTLAHLA